jgi:hypothetical protein
MSVEVGVPAGLHFGAGISRSRGAGFVMTMTIRAAGRKGNYFRVNFAAGFTKFTAAGSARGIPPIR